MAYILVLAT